MSDLPKKSDPILQQKVSELSTAAANPQFTQAGQAPQVNQVAEGGVLFATISGTTYLYTKVKGILKRVALT